MVLHRQILFNLAIAVVAEEIGGMAQAGTEGEMGKGES